jgi:hypothetical protein
LRGRILDNEKIGRLAALLKRLFLDTAMALVQVNARLLPLTVGAILLAVVQKVAVRIIG